jgi:dihydroorotate dehydrogenase electron transfer subunit
MTWVLGVRAADSMVTSSPSHRAALKSRTSITPNPEPNAGRTGPKKGVQYTAAVPIDIRAEVVSNAALSSDYNVLALRAPAIARAVEPGQFVMVKATDGCDPLLRRPFSVFELLRDSIGAPFGISLLNKRIGVSTSRLYEAAPGQKISCFGPLGQPFRVADPPSDAWMVAGGVGLAPFLTLSRALAERGVAQTLFYGARTGGELFYLDRFRTLGVTLVTTTEDGSVGERGRISLPLERALEGRERDRPVTIYACGPEGMLAACARIAGRFNRPCYVSVERVMGCGMGGCYSCVIPMRSEGGRFHHVRACISGPVLPADRVIWD